MNGHANGHANGHVNGSIHGSSSRSSKSKKTTKPKRNYVGWAIDKGTKVFVWVTLATVVFRCPSSPQQLTEKSPSLCKPYFQVRDFVVPYAKPHYDQYLAPHVQKTRPYVDRLRDQVYKPGVAVYEKHGAHRVVQAQKFGNERWQKTIKPQLDVLQQQAEKQYDASLAPHVKKARDVVQPYYVSAKNSANCFWTNDLQPIYQKTAPYAQNLYSQGHDFAVNTALPHAHYASNVTWSFWKRHIWPRIRVLYGENVEPQLMRITERLGRYKDGKKLEADIKSMEASSKLEGASASAASIGSILSSSIIDATADRSAAASMAASSTPKADPLSQFYDELKSWETINAKAVDEGSEDLMERIKDITAHQASSQANGVGKALVVQLEEAADGAIGNLKSRIQHIVKDLSKDADEDSIQKANDDVQLAIRYAGQSVKHRAQAVRDWRQSYQTETENLIDKALQSTLETIDGIRELRLSEIGRKYASSTLPHKAWSKYNELKKATRSWRDKVEKAAKSHDGIRAADNVGQDIERSGMAIAEEVAQELGRLKEVGKWKVSARDDTDNFDTKYIPPVAERARQQVIGKAADAANAAFGSESKGTVEEVTSSLSDKASQLASSASEAARSVQAEQIVAAASDRASQAASAVSEAVIGSSTGTVESAASAFSDKASSVALGASEAVLGSSTGSVESLASKLVGSAQSIVSAASQNLPATESSLTDTLADAASKASEAILGTPSGLSDTATDIASDVSGSASSLASSISSGVAGAVSSKPLNSKMASILSAQKSNQEEIVSGVSDAAKTASSSVESVLNEAASSASSFASDASSSASGPAAKASKKVFGGAMASILVEAREPILDDIVDDSESYSARLQSLLSAAGDQASALTQAVEEALKQATSTQGSFESATSLASQQYESAIAAASSALFRTKGTAEKGTSLAREQYLAAVTAASYAIYGTPSAASLLAQANSLYSSVVSEASQNFELVRSEVSKQVSGSTPVPVYQQILANAEAAYSNVIATASSNFYSPLASSTRGADDSISAIASSRLAEGVSFASAQFQSAKIAVGVQPTPVHQQYLASAQRAYYEALGVAHDQYSQFIDAASSAVGATPTTGLQGALAAAQSTYSAAIAAASSNLEALVSSASSVVGATTKSPAESVLASFSSQYDAAVAVASSQLVLASSRASEAFYGKPTGAFDAAASAASTAVYGSETPLTESIASQAAENWEILLSKASQQVYGAPPPLTAVVAQQAGEYAAQASQAAAAQFSAVQALFSELIAGREPDFTESVMSRLQSAYSSDIPAVASSASSYVSVAYASAASVAASVFVPPTAVPGIFEQFTEQLNSAVDAASAQMYGTPKNTFQQATEAAASAYSDAASAVSEAVYGHETGIAEAAQSNIVDIGASASSAISVAIYGPGSVAVASSAAASVYSSLSSQAAEQASAASAAVSSAVYGEEQTYAESLQSQLSVAVASASSRIAVFGTQASAAAGDSMSAAQEVFEDVASSVSSLASEASSRVRDEL